MLSVICRPHIGGTLRVWSLERVAPCLAQQLTLRRQWLQNNDCAVDRPVRMHVEVTQAKTTNIPQMRLAQPSLPTRRTERNSSQPESIITVVSLQPDQTMSQLQ